MNWKNSALNSLKKKFNLNYISMQFLRSYIVLMLAIALVLSSCGKKNNELIIGKWKIDDITSPKPNVPDSLIEYYNKKMEIQNTLILTTGYYEFLKGGKCFFLLDGDKYEGKWRLSEDEQKLFTKERGSATEEEFDIKDLNESIFTIESTIDGQMRRMVMKKEVN
jgi:hypothetical protein